MRRVFFHTILFVYLILHCTISSATDEPQINNLTIQNGLAGETIFKIFKDYSGLIWIGTSNGLNCYNGVSLQTFNANPQKLLNAVLDIAQTQNRKLYFSTRNGVFQLNAVDDQLTRIIPSIKCLASALASDGNSLYIGTAQGLYVYDEKGTKHFFVSKDLMSERNDIKDIFVDKKHQIWLITDRDLFLFNKHKQSLQAFNIDRQIHFLGNLHVLTVVNDKVFIGSDNDGIFTFDIPHRRITKYINVGCNVITDLSSDGANLYVATDGNGAHIISLKSNKVVQSFTVNTFPALQDNSVYSFMHDPSGVNWFGYFRYGLTYSYYVNPIFHTYSFGNFTTKGINVRSFCINGAQKIIGTRNGLYFIDENRNIIKYYSPAELGGGIVTSVCAYNNEYYIATYDGGVSVLNPSNLQVKRFDLLQGLIYGSFSKLVVSPQNELWMGSNQGVFVYNAKTNKIINYTQDNSQLYNSYVNNLMFDRQGRCWISTQMGLCIYNPQDKIIRSSGFPQNFFNKESELNCTQGDDNNIVCFSFNGLFKTDEGMAQFGLLKLNRKVYNNYISLIIHDKLGNYWIGTEHGLFRYDDKFSTFQHYGNDYNLQNPLFSTQSCYIDNNDDLWLGSKNGLVYANLLLINKERNSHLNIIPDKLYLNGDRVNLANLFKFINKHKINVSWNIKSDEVMFRPILLNYSNPNNRYFEYKFNSQKKWTLISENEFISCKHLNIGTNKLYIRLAGNANATVYNIIAIPSFGFVIELILFILIVTGIWKHKDLQHYLDKFIKPKTQPSQKEKKEDEEKYKRVKMDEDELEELHKRLIEYIEANKPYLNPMLKMSDLATELNCSSMKLSQLLNIYIKENYYNFINKYRLEEFKKRLTNPEYSKYTIVALAEQCGFKRSSFFSVFKKFMGITPAEYLHKMNVNKKID